MSYTEQTIVFKSGPYEFTACCGVTIKKDTNICNKCARPIEKVFEKEDGLHFAHEIWQNTLREQFLIELGALLISEGTDIVSYYTEKG